ncbi:hypothetical protein PVBG_06099 [Plasmodium vivax Brazil I]|uniref:CYIR protein n=1 Tax=Plasmodium vivax (strain Brazil I) TaxID=1033975 RepID=A0A0J9T0M1_PLAV1|nr:hypothetical protein PVBG_06099 [Plasmodium vivax Brazil I]
MITIIYNDELNKLPTKKYYSYFVKELGECNHVNFYDGTKQRIYKLKGLENVYDKIMNAVCYVYNQSKIPGFAKNICDFLYYWISDMLLTHLEEKSLYNQVIMMLFDVILNTGGNKVCNVLHWSMDKEHKFEDIKLMFDYSKDYNTYKEQFIETNPQCYKGYKLYLEKYKFF